MKFDCKKTWLLIFMFAKSLLQCFFLLQYFLLLRDHPFKTSANFHDFWPLPPYHRHSSKMLMKGIFDPYVLWPFDHRPLGTPLPPKTCWRLKWMVPSPKLWHISLKARTSNFSLLHRHTCMRAKVENFDLLPIFQWINQWESIKLFSTSNQGISLVHSNNTRYWDRALEIQR